MYFSDMEVVRRKRVCSVEYEKIININLWLPDRN